MITDQPYKTGQQIGKLRRTIVTIKAKTNDRWLNSHNNIAILVWLANMDMSLLVDAISVIAYVAKYASKSDTVSLVVNKILSGAIRHGQEMGNLNSCRVLRRAFNRIAGRRDKCTQEISHLIMSEPYVVCSHKFTTINLKSLVRKVNINGEGNAYVRNITDLYSERLQKPHWRDQTLYETVKLTLPNMPFSSFVDKYLAGKDSKIARRSNDNSHTVCIYSPEYKSKSTLNTYYKYCWVSLLKYKPWQNYVESLFGDENDKNSCIDMDLISDENRLRIISTWELFLLDNANNDSLMREIERLQEPNERDEDEADGIVHSQNEGFEADPDQPDYVSIFKRMTNDNEDDIGEMEWNKNVDFNATTNLYANNENSIQYIKDKWITVKSEEHFQIRPPTMLTDLQAQQKQCVQTFLFMNGLMKDENGNFLDKRVDNESRVPNGMIIVGTAGTGKSYTINAMINEIIARRLEKNQERTVLIMAPTGRAAMQASGYTLQCKDGLSIPLFSGIYSHVMIFF